MNPAAANPAVTFTDFETNREIRAKLGKCAICRDSMKNRKKPLSAHEGNGQLHPYHKECIENAIKQAGERPSCPSCRASVRPINAQAPVAAVQPRPILEENPLPNCSEIIEGAAHGAASTAFSCVSSIGIGSTVELCASTVLDPVSAKALGCAAGALQSITGYTLVKKISNGHEKIISIAARAAAMGAMGTYWGFSLPYLVGNLALNVINNSKFDNSSFNPPWEGLVGVAVNLSLPHLTFAAVELSTVVAAAPACATAVGVAAVAGGIAALAKRFF